MRKRKTRAEAFAELDRAVRALWDATGIERHLTRAIDALARLLRRGRQ